MKKKELLKESPVHKFESGTIPSIKYLVDLSFYGIPNKILNALIVKFIGHLFCNNKKVLSKHPQPFLF